MPVWMAIALIVAMLVAGAVGLAREWPKPAVDPDRIALEQLQKAGSNLAKAHDVEFFLLFTTLEGAQAAARELSEAGYATSADSVDTGNSWFCKATKSLVPELALLRRIRATLSGLAIRLGGKYDGWGTPVVR
jgi:regulator of RNase E activity RraB